MSHEDKVRKKVENDPSYDAFYQSVVGLGSNDLKQNMLMFQKYLQETLTAMKIHPEIIKVSAEQAAAEKPYKDLIKEAKDKIKQLKKFVDDSICVEDLEKQMVRFTMKAEEQKVFMSMDVDVLNAKEELKQLKGPFNDAKSVLEMKISYLYFLIKERGGDLDDEE